MQLLRTPCAWQESYGINLQGLGKTWLRVELSTYQHRSGRTYHQARVDDKMDADLAHLT